MATTALAMNDPNDNNEPLDTLRARLTAAAPNWADDAITGLKEALKATKRARVQRNCTKCGCAHIEYVEIQDSAKVLDALKLTIEQTEGRPGVAGEQQDSGLTIHRTVYGSQTEALPGRVEGEALTHTRDTELEATTEQLWPRPDPDA